MNLLVDMNLSPRWVEVLRTNGIEAVHWSSVGNVRATDREIMAYAVQHQRVVLTHDLDFGAILAASNLVAPSVVQIRSGNTDPDVIAAPLLAALRQLAPELAVGALVTVDATRSRVRVLPLRERN
jgi:predicted nuclease of predicted toxin-antitoxin system